VPATTHVLRPFGNLKTPQSLDTYRSPLESRAIPVAGGLALGVDLPDTDRLNEFAATNAIAAAAAITTRSR
jgi:hypothetical protein